MNDHKRYFVIKFKDGNIFSFQMISGGDKLNQFLSGNTKKYKCFYTQEEMNDFLKKYRAHKNKKQEFSCIRLTEGFDE